MLEFYSTHKTLIRKNPEWNTYDPCLVYFHELNFAYLRKKKSLKSTPLKSGGNGP